MTTPPFRLNRYQTCCSALLMLLTSLARADDSFGVLHTFGTNLVGNYPQSALVLGPDNFLYGTAQQGGLANRGQIFKVQPDGSSYTVLRDFTGPDGTGPLAALLLDGAWLYGATEAGGSNDFGTVFRLTTNGTDFAVLKHFAGDNGAGPISTLLLAEDVLFGTTASGGADGYGTVFRLNTDGTEFVVLKDFAGDLDGSWPFGRLALSGTTLCGTAQGGGANGCGVLFKLQTDGTGFAVMRHFAGQDGTSPSGDLLLHESVLYGTTSWGGINQWGTIYRVNTDGTDFATLHHFQGEIGGGGPRSGVSLVGSKLWGAAIEGGASHYGVIFSLETNGTSFQVLKDFKDYTTDGAYPSALVLSGARLYGALGEGGLNQMGALFSIGQDGSDFRLFLSFAGGDGVSPIAVAFSGNTLFGTTENGGLSGSGTVFRLNTTGADYLILKHFTNTAEGVLPQVAPLLVGSEIYGTTASGGTNYSGTIFKMHTNGEAFQVLHHFSTNGSSGPLCSDGSILYGTAWDHVFRLNLDGSGFNVLRWFDSAAEGMAAGALTVSDGVLYGATRRTSGQTSCVYQINANGTGFRVLKSFPSPVGDPMGGLLLSGTKLFGCTSGGSYDYGTLFSLNTDGTGFTVLKTFLGTEGTFPSPPLSLSGSTLIGTTATGGAFGRGTIFSLGLDDTSFVVLKNLEAGGGPRGGVALVGETMYGACAWGGFLDFGIAFRFSPGLPKIDSLPDTTEPLRFGSTLTLQAFVSAYPACGFQWYFNSTNLVPGATGSQLVLTNLDGTFSGYYSLVLSNSYGSVTSPPMAVVVLDPWFADSPQALTVRAGQAASFSAVPRGTPPLPCQWFKGSTPLLDNERVSGVHTTSLTISNVALVDEGLYHLQVSNQFRIAETESASLVVLDPFIDVQPASTNVAPGQPVLLSVSAGGTSPFAYSWRKDGRPIPGSTGPSLSFSPARASDAGLYEVIVSNELRSATSTGAWLTVNLAVPEDLSSRAWPTYALALQPDGKILLGGGFTLLGDQAQQYMGRLLPDGSLDAGFRPVPNNRIRAVALQADGKILIGGVFTNVNGQSALRIARLLVSGDLDTNFIAAADGAVRAILVQPDGKIILGGVFQNLNSVPRSFIARLNTDGTLDPSFEATASGFVLCLGLQPDGKILVGGDFSRFNQSQRPMLVRLNTDGSLDASFFAASVNHQVYSRANTLVLQQDGKVLAGGWWADDSGFVGLPRLVRLNANGSLDQDFATVVDGEPYAFALQAGGKIVVVGAFSSLNGVPIRYLGRLEPDGATDLNFNLAPQVPIYCGCFEPDGKLLVGGRIGSGPVPPSGLARLSFLSPPQPTIAPAAQTAEAGSFARLAVHDEGNPHPVYQWYRNGTLVTGATNSTLSITTATFLDVGNYLVRASNAVEFGTSAPAVLNVIAPVDHRVVPAIFKAGATNGSLTLEYTETFRSADWSNLSPFILEGTPRLYLDLATPTPAARFYRGAEPSPVTSPLVLNLFMLPEITLSGNVGSTVQLDYINQVGPTNDWHSLATLSLTNPPQRYFDLTAPGQPARLYRVLQLP